MTAYIDRVAVERAADGENVHLTPAERRAAVTWLSERGYSGREIAQRLRVSERTVLRVRARLRSAS